MNSHDRQAHPGVPTREELEAYIRGTRELRSQAIARHTKWMLARANNRLRSLLGPSAGTSHRPGTTS